MSLVRANGAETEWMPFVNFTHVKSRQLPKKIKKIKITTSRECSVNTVPVKHTVQFKSHRHTKILNIFTFIMIDLIILKGAACGLHGNKFFPPLFSTRCFFWGHVVRNVIPSKFNVYDFTFAEEAHNSWPNRARATTVNKQHTVGLQMSI